ncbi:hypothetical protein GYA93_15705 [Gordonia desulfuricans]|uniref:Uncharacterized protein n=1 Tax=Gordonia desulfuricans TaxID=89051 RepID=A0A7K3LTX1_9ACTN|nr:hypothetical protein [Gordonia desulfuricans]NDK91017.1 hypothetical protein [Gordonia desulfuricans]
MNVKTIPAGKGRARIVVDGKQVAVVERRTRAVSNIVEDRSVAGGFSHTKGGYPESTSTTVVGTETGWEVVTHDVPGAEVIASGRTRKEAVQQYIDKWL